MTFRISVWGMEAQGRKEGPSVQREALSVAISNVVDNLWLLGAIKHN